MERANRVSPHQPPLFERPHGRSANLNFTIPLRYSCLPRPAGLAFHPVVDSFPRDPILPAIMLRLTTLRLIS
jgi:hypothetical protein